MRISIVTDEISADPETAIELGVEWGVHDFELRGFGTDRVPLFSAYQKERLKEVLEEFGAQIVAISPGLFKIPFPLGKRGHFPLRTLDYALHERWRGDHDQLKYHLEELLPRSIEFATELGAGLIVVFGFHRGGRPAGEAPEEVREALEHAGSQAHRASVKLAIEVEDEFWADTGERTSELIRAINQPALGVNWDPGNAFGAGETPFPNGYVAVRSHVQHVHFKDVDADSNGNYSYVLEGQIDWPGQIGALASDGYEGHISVETHMQPKVYSARAMTERLQRLIKDATNP